MKEMKSRPIIQPNEFAHPRNYGKASAKHVFKELPVKQEMKLFMEFNSLMAKYFPNSVADGVAGMSWCLGATIRAYINEGVFSEDALQFFGEAVSTRLPSESRI